jgi:pyridoxine kinase
MRTLSISSQVVWGPVGNSAAVPALQALGHEVLSLPTITLSNHPGHGQPAGFSTQPEDMARMLAALEALGALHGLDAVMTGYFASAGQVEEVSRLLARIEVPFLLVDPVMGDHGRLYVPPDVAEAIRDHLVPRAACLTPNGFELAWLTGRDVSDEAGAIAAARALGLREVLATSIPAEGGRLATLLITPDEVHNVTTPRLHGVPHGTGDFLSGLYLGERLVHPPKQALAAAMKTLARAIALSAGTPVLDVAGALHGT